MGRLVAITLQGLTRHLALLVVITFLLMAGYWLVDQAKLIATAEQDIDAAQRAMLVLEDEPARLVTLSRSLVPATSHLEAEAESILAKVEKNVVDKRADIASLKRAHPFARRIPLSPVFLKVRQLELELKILQEAETQLRKVVNLVRALKGVDGAITKCKAALEQLDLAIRLNRARERQVHTKGGIWIHIPGTGWRHELSQLDIDHRMLLDKHGSVLNQLQTLEGSKRAVDKALTTVRFVATSLDDARAFVKPQLDEIMSIRDERVKDIQGNWWHQLTTDFMGMLPKATLILVGAILTAPCVKALVYYVIAPLAASRPPHRLTPGARGDVKVRSIQASPNSPGATSAPSIPVVLDAGEELLVRADFVKSRSATVAVRTLLFLDPARPLMSVAADMCFLNRFAFDEGQPVMISSSQLDFTEISIVEIGASSAFVLRPHALVGVVQQTDHPLRITSEWCFATLRSWLTLQFRHLVFHGPGQLLVKGSRGVVLVPADQGKVINQRGVIGFSPGLARSMRRCETFFSYLRGDLDLLNEHFHGDRGWVLIEEAPSSPGKNSLIYGRGFDGVTDAFLKVVGI